MSRKDTPPLGESVKLCYGPGYLDLNLTGFLKVKVFSPPETEAPIDLASAVVRSLSDPVGCPPLARLAESARRIVISIPDRTRPRVAREILPMIFNVLLEAGVATDAVTIFVATGTHAEHRDEELRDLVGEQLPSGILIYQNRARKTDDFEMLGTTSRGTPVLVNRVLVQADLNIVVGTVAYHYFAGWGGGRKMLIPGAADFETTCANHRLNIDENGELCPTCRSGVLGGNPVNEDMVEAARFVDHVFMINVILDGWARIAGVVSGDMIESHLKAVEKAKGLLEVDVGGKCDLAIVSAGGHPLDLNLVQAHKSIEHAAECVRSGGVILALAECANGLGSDDLMTWFDLGDVQAVSRRLKWKYGIHGHTALSFMKKLERLHIILLSSLAAETVEHMGMIPAQNIEEALSATRSLAGSDALTYVFPCAWGILPVP